MRQQLAWQSGFLIGYFESAATNPDLQDGAGSPLFLEDPQAAEAVRRAELKRQWM
jgi:hypothetical protein